ncbi:hypothetical protein [Acidiphilium sp. 20-67-58]|uniref:hypothetical protein n=1 Tax=Acidiphilium sp. 20-67-58 TaxID=1970291 RepID=UPI0025C3CEEA|nr:hypothetical protein [Acidiphilium sp. 20-67-58]
MASPIKITVRGTEIDGEDAPTVEDLLAQIQDFVAILCGVEESISTGGKREIIWRVTDASKNSPLSFEITPFPREHAMNIDRRAAQVIMSTTRGVKEIAKTGERPAHFSDNLVSRIERIFDRVTNGLADTSIDVSGYDQSLTVDITRSFAANASRAILSARPQGAVPHREIGSVEGTITRVELDGYGRPVVWLRARLDGQVVKCVAHRGALDRIGHYEIMEVLKGMRVSVHGLISYKDYEEFGGVEVEGVHVFPPDEELPDHQNIVDPGFTKGLEASEYLEAIRNDG